MSRASLTVSGLLLFVMAVGGAVEWWLWKHRPSGGAASLSRSQLWSLPTYHRHCFSAADCEPPLSCIPDSRAQGYRCLGTECQVDAQCAVGEACREVAGRGPNVRLCLVEGERKEGERCEDFPLWSREACKSGLVCNELFCGRPCRLEDPASCPEGYTCLANQTLESSCVPTCLSRGCPDGGRCIRIENDFSICGTVDEEEDCEKHPCPPGQECARAVVRHSDRVAMWCRYGCNEKKACPSGLVCYYTTCRVPCGADAGTCGSDEECVEYPDDRVALCTPKRKE